MLGLKLNHVSKRGSTWHNSVCKYTADHHMHTYVTSVNHQLARDSEIFRFHADQYEEIMTETECGEEKWMMMNNNTRILLGLTDWDVMGPFSIYGWAKCQAIREVCYICYIFCHCPIPYSVKAENGTRWFNPVSIEILWMACIWK